MFVTKRRFEKLYDKYFAIYHEMALEKAMHERLLAEYNILVGKVNDKGGHKFLECGTVQPTLQVTNQFTNSELRVMKVLADPSRHKDARIAHDITAKLDEILNKKPKRGNDEYQRTKG